MQKVEKQIEINAPVEEVFALFSRFDHFARWMKGIKNVEWIAPKRMCWTAEAPDGQPLEWEAEVTELEPGRHVAWHSIGGNLEAEGDARFETTAQGTTLMHLALGYEQQQWQADEKTVAAFVNNLEQRLEDDLIWFRLYAEREAQAQDASGDITENISAAPAVPVLSVTATPALGTVANEAEVYFDTFSTIRRSGKVIRPARPLTAQLPEQAEPAFAPAPEFSEPARANYAPTPAHSYFNNASGRPSRRSIFVYAAIGHRSWAVAGCFANSWPAVG